MKKADGYAERFLWNRNADGLIRVLQRMESIGILSKQDPRRWRLVNETIKFVSRDSEPHGKAQIQTTIASDSGQTYQILQRLLRVF